MMRQEVKNGVSASISPFRRKPRSAAVELAAACHACWRIDRHAMLRATLGHGTEIPFGDLASARVNLVSEPTASGKDGSQPASCWGKKREGR